MNIDRHNYEEFFILYLDNELSAEERSRVEDFAAANPDLKVELNLLLQSKLVPDTDLIFNGKEELLKHADGIGSHNYTEWLLLYTDNELDPAQRSSLEQWIAQNPTAQQELSLLQKTRFQPDESVVFPYKQSLYRTEERRTVAIRWWRMAAAAVLLLGVSTAAFMFNQKRKADPIAAGGNGTVTSGPVAQINTSAGKDSHNVAPVENTGANSAADATAVNTTGTAAANTGEEPSSKIDNIDNKKAAQPDAFVVNKVESKQETATPVNADPVTEENNPVVKRTTDMSEVLDNSRSVANVDLNADPSLTIQKQITPLPGVTQEDPEALDIVNQSGKKNRLRGFFRKITRTFEKTTNIKATDGDDRLLVGGLAIKF